MINPTLFDCIKLMEFEKKYHEVQSIYELYPDWSKRADAKISFFTSAGLSYLEAGFNFICETGSDIIAILQIAYLDYNKEIKICHIPSIIFLNNTPKVDDLEINPEPDIIIKTWFDNMLKGMKSGCPKSEYPRHRVKTEFNTIETQLEYEWNAWKKTSASDKAGDMIAKHRPKLGKTASLIYEKLLTLPKHKAMNLTEITLWLWEEHKINLADSTVYQKHLKKLEPWGLQHDKRIGYSIN